MDPVTLSRLNASLRDLLVELLERRVRDRRVRAVVLTAVEVSGDLSVARVYYNLLGEAAAREEAQAGLDSVAGFLRREAGRRLRLRTVPELRFLFDSSLERGERIETLLREIHAREAQDDTPPPEEDPEDA